MSLANPFGVKVDQVSTVTGAELTAAGIAIAKAMDGTSGGSYSPSSPLAIGGTGISLTAPLALSGTTACVGYRINATTLSNAAADLTVASDVWITSTAALAGNIIYTIRHTSPVAAQGNRVRLLRAMVGAFYIEVQREDGTMIWRSLNAVRTWVDFMFDGTNWRTVGWDDAGTGAVLI